MHYFMNGSIKSIGETQKAKSLNKVTQKLVDELQNVNTLT
jgi:hypothetical protein